MIIILAIALFISAGLLLKKLVSLFGGPDAEQLSYWDSFGWIIAPRLICRGITFLFPAISKGTLAFIWVALFMTIVPLVLRYAFSVPLTRAILISFAALVLLLIEVLAFLWK